MLNGEFGPAELKSILWTAVDLRERSIQHNEVHVNAQYVTLDHL